MVMKGDLHIYMTTFLWRVTNKRRLHWFENLICSNVATIFGIRVMPPKLSKGLRVLLNGNDAMPPCGDQNSCAPVTYIYCWLCLSYCQSDFKGRIWVEFSHCSASSYNYS